VTGQAGDVVVVGAVNVDMVVATPSLPGPGETVVGDGVRRFGGGKGANAAVAAARAGARVRYVGAVGDDDLGRGALDELRAEGVAVDDVAVLGEAATGTALIVVDEKGENQIAVGLGANGRVDPQAVRSALAGALGPAGCLLVSTEIPGEAIAAAVRAGADAGVRCVLNPAPVVEVVDELLALGVLLTPNAGEAAAVARSDGRDPVADARAITGRTGAPVVVTLGGDGALVADPAGGVERVPPRPAAARDTTGAGDTFNGVLAARLAAGDDLVEAVRTANVAAALSVTAVGARGGMPTGEAITAAREAAP
jgi:ribokinase